MTLGIAGYKCGIIKWLRKRNGCEQSETYGEAVFFWSPGKPQANGLQWLT